MSVQQIDPCHGRLAVLVDHRIFKPIFSEIIRIRRIFNLVSDNLNRTALRPGDNTSHREIITIYNMARCPIIIHNIQRDGIRIPHQLFIRIIQCIWLGDLSRRVCPRVIGEQLEITKCNRLRRTSIVKHNVNRVFVRIRRQFHRRNILRPLGRGDNPGFGFKRIVSRGRCHRPTYPNRRSLWIWSDPIRPIEKIQHQ